MSFNIYKDYYDAERKALILTNYDLRAITADIIESYGSCAVHLDFSHNRLSDLTWIREFPVCQELILDNNRLSEISLHRLIGQFENVKILMLNKNEFADLHLTIEHLSRIFPNLEHLSLHGNAICPDGLGLRPFSDYIQYSYDYYRSFVVSAFPSLKFLDHASTEYVDFGGMLNTSSSLKRTRLIKQKLNRFLSNSFCLGQSEDSFKNDTFNTDNNQATTKNSENL